MRSIKWLSLCLLLPLLLCSLGVQASDNRSQTVNLKVLGETLMLSTTEEPAFWEIPDLRAGEVRRESGTLTLCNETDAERTIQLETVAFPYDSESALLYLNHLIITVRDGQTVLYEGPYSRINETDGLSLQCRLAAHASHSYQIDLRCDYTYIGAGLPEGKLIDWKFLTVTSSATSSTTDAHDPALREMILSAAAAVLLIVGVCVYEKLRHWQRRRQSSSDSEP